MIIKKDREAIRAYFEDSSNLKGGHADDAAFPEDIDTLCEFIKYANKKNIPVTVSGGGTGTTAGRIPFGGTVVSMERFNDAPLILKDTMSARVQAGVLVEDFKGTCEREGLFYPCHPTEKNGVPRRHCRHKRFRSAVIQIRSHQALCEAFKDGPCQRRDI